MAVEKQRLVDRFKAIFGGKVNLSAERINELAERLSQIPEDGADDSAIDAMLNQANAMFPFDAIAKNDDKIRGLEAKAKGVKTPAEIAAEEAARIAALENPKPGDEVPSWAAAILESNKTIAQRMEAIENGKVIDAKRSSISELFGKSEVFKGLKPEMKSNWEKRVDLNSQTPIEDQILSIENEFNELKQTFSNGVDYAGATPKGFNSSAPTDAEVDAMVAKMQ